jgi:elongation factor Ts
MAEITASLVKDLREKTGAGMLDCKKALVEAGGNLEDAIDWLRKKGLATAAKKAGRTASQGLVAAKVDGKKGVVLEVNSETDFVARNADFQGFVAKALDVALNTDGDVEALKAADMGGKSVSDTLTDLVAKIGEHLNVRRVETLTVENGVVVPYVHNAVVPGMGKIGVLVALESEADTGALTVLGKQIAMHAAAVAPVALNIADVPADLVQREKDIISEQAKASGKPEAIIEKMIDGRLRKFYEEVVLMEQDFVMDNEKKVKDVVADFAKENGKDVKLKAFVRFNLGEGIEKQETDFAAEVAAQLGK